MAFNYFSIDYKTVTILGASFRYPFARPAGSGNVDVYSKMHWKNSGSIEEVPSVLVTEKSLDYGIWTSNLLRLLNNVGSVTNNESNDPYAVLYLASETGFKYIFPYLVPPGASLRGSINNNWNDITKEQGYGGMVGAVPMVGGLMKTGYERLTEYAEMAGRVVSPGYGAEPIKMFNATSPKTITISFPLYNTYSVEQANNHFSFISLFGLQNLKTRVSYLTYLPPKIYTVESTSDGGIYMPAAYVSQFDVQSIGTTRAIQDTGTLTGSGNPNRLLPEAYKVIISFTELLPESSNIYGSVLGGSKVSVTADPAVVASQQGTVNGISTPLPNIPGTFNPGAIA